MADEPKTKGKIFLLDDDAFLLDMYSLKFKNAGYDVQTVNDPEEAVEALRGEYIPDIILFDIVMPGIGGWGFVEKVREEKLAEGATVIVLSNQGQQSDFDTSKKYAVDGYIVKALTTPSEVLAEVEKIHATKHTK